MRGERFTLYGLRFGLSVNGKPQFRSKFLSFRQQLFTPTGPQFLPSMLTQLKPCLCVGFCKQSSSQLVNQSIYAGIPTLSQCFQALVFFVRQSNGQCAHFATSCRKISGVWQLIPGKDKSPPVRSFKLRVTMTWALPATASSIR